MSILFSTINRCFVWVMGCIESVLTRMHLLASPKIDNMVNAMSFQSEHLGGRLFNSCLGINQPYPQEHQCASVAFLWRMSRPSMVQGLMDNVTCP